MLRIGPSIKQQSETTKCACAHTQAPTHETKTETEREGGDRGKETHKDPEIVVSLVLSFRPARRASLVSSI
jgi:hypothetical protein